MSTNSNRPEINSELLDVGHELPAGQAAGGESQTSSQPASTTEESPGGRTDLEKVKEERDALRDRVARLQAEFENSRKRDVREQQEFKEFALGDVLKSLLPVLDSFDRALQAPSQSVKEFRSGIELIQKQFEDALVKLGLTPIPAEGRNFDPSMHEAIEMVDSTRTNDNQVVKELQRGYKLRDRLLRPAMVRVGRNPQHDSKPEAA